MLQADIEEEIEAAPRPKAKWTLVVVPNDGDHPFVEHFSSSASMAGRLMEISDREYFAYPFFGHLGVISEGPNRFLHFPHNSDLYPLFELQGADIELDTEEITAQKDYYLGDEDVEIIEVEEIVDTKGDVDLTVELVEGR